MNTSILPLRAGAARAPTDAPDYTLAVADGARRTLARAWLWLGLLALVGSGLFSVLLVLSRDRH